MEDENKTNTAWSFTPETLGHSLKAFVKHVDKSVGKGLVIFSRIWKKQTRINMQRKVT